MGVCASEAGSAVSTSKAPTLTFVSQSGITYTHSRGLGGECTEPLTQERVVGATASSWLPEIN